MYFLLTITVKDDKDICGRFIDRENAIKQFNMAVSDLRAIESTISYSATHSLGTITLDAVEWGKDKFFPTSQKLIQKK